MTQTEFVRALSLPWEEFRHHVLGSCSGLAGRDLIAKARSINEQLRRANVQYQRGKTRMDPIQENLLGHIENLRRWAYNNYKQHEYPAYRVRHQHLSESGAKVAFRSEFEQYWAPGDF